jgi:leucyl/phenylalanyl-tRNA--protein transferase
MSSSSGADALTPQILLNAYELGIFPMSESADDPDIFWVEPRQRGIFPLDAFHVPKRLARTVRADLFDVACDVDFDGVIEGCAAPAPGRETTWINPIIRDLYGELFRLGHVHTVECRREGRLVGGLYGVAMKGAFFGESMFSFETDASKVALVHLVARLKRGGFSLLDAQFITPHLARFGAIEIPRREYQRRLAHALANPADHGVFGAGTGGAGGLTSGEEALQSVSQTS